MVSQPSRTGKWRERPTAHHSHGTELVFAHGIQHQIENQEHLILAAAFPFAYNSRFSADEYSGLDLLHSSSEFSLKDRFFQSELTQDEAAPDGIHVDISEVGYFGVW
jgi:hypothetical protein